MLDPDPRLSFEVPRVRLAEADTKWRDQQSIADARA